MSRLPACLLLFAALAPAHDIPAGVTVHMLLDAAPPQARLLVRVPLSSMRDIDYTAADLDPQLRLAATQWLAQPVELHGAGERLAPRLAAFRLSLPSDRSFVAFPEALAHTTRVEAPPDANPEQLLFDVLLEYPLPAGAALSLRPGLHHLAADTTIVLRVSSPGRPIRAYQFHNDPGLVPLDPHWSQAAGRFLALGFEHILDGADHLLFLLCLVLPFRRLRELALIVTAFTLAHSVTLIASAHGMAPDALWFPPLVETLIAASILFMALENLAAAIPQNAAPPPIHRRWLTAFAFGLVHGFGFSFALRDSLQFAGDHLTASLLAFNLGVEAGQLLVVAALVPALSLLFRFALPERTGILLASALVAHTSWHWLSERFTTLRQFRITMPELTAPALAALFQWLLILWLAVGLLYLLARLIRSRSASSPAASPPAAST
jgi:hypothetical protein